MDNEITAKKAKSIAIEVQRKPFFKLLKAIEVEANKGNTLLWWYESIPLPSIKDLEEKGFTVKNEFDRGDTLIKIEW